MSIFLTRQSSADLGGFDQGASEIVDFDPGTSQAFITNSADNVIEVRAVAADGSIAQSGTQLDVSGVGGDITAVAVKNGLVAVSVATADADGNVTTPGRVVLFDAESGAQLNDVAVGVLPDNLKITPDGSRIVVANEGEFIAANGGSEDNLPGDPGVNDPVGSISIIDVSNGAANASVQTAGFESFNGQEDALRAEGVRLFDTTAARDLEPEFVTIAPDGETAFVSLQENNALAVVDIASATVTDIIGLGAKDHSLAGQGLDASEDDNAVNIAPAPVKGLFQPDSIASFTDASGATFIVTANEGDSRGADEADIEDVTLDPTAFPNTAQLQQETALGGLEISTIDGDPDGDGDFDELFAFGGRSFSIWNESGDVVFDSGDLFERITASNPRTVFNADNDEPGADERSGNKGPEPEALDVGQVGDQTFAFVGLERVGGVTVFDITDPAAPSFVQFINPRDFTADIESPAAGDLGPEGIRFVSAEEAGGDTPLLLVGNEVSGTTSVFQINDSRAEDAAKLVLAYTGRAADPATLDALNGQLASGSASEADLAGQLAAGAEAQAVHPFLAAPSSNPEAIQSFLDTVFDNLFDRDPTAQELTVWSGEAQFRLDNDEPVARLPLDIANAATDADRTTLDTKIQAALDFANGFATSGKAFTFGDDVIGATEAVDGVDGGAQSRAAAIADIEDRLGVAPVTDQLAGDGAGLVPTDADALAVARLFVGHTGRAVDPATLRDLTGQLDRGEITLGQIAAELAAGEEARALHPFLASPSQDEGAITDFLDTVYDNLFDRDITAPGRDFWVANIQNAVERGAEDGVIFAIVNGALGDDAAALDNKAAAALSFAEGFARLGRDFDSGQDLIAATEAVDEVGADGTTLAEARAEIAADLGITGTNAVSVPGLFLGFTGRAIDPETLNDLTGRLDSGEATLAQIATDLAQTPEAQSVLPFLAAPSQDPGAILTFLDTVFDNLFDRDLRPAEADTLVAEIQDSVAAGQPVERLVLDIARSAEGADRTALNAKAEVAEIYADSFATLDRSFDPTSDLIGATEAVDDVDAGGATLTEARQEIADFIADDEVAPLGILPEDAETLASP